MKEEKELPWKDKTDKEIELVYFIIGALIF